MRSVYTTDQEATQGVLRGVWNELAPTNPATRTVNVATGKGFVNGHLLINDAVAAIGVDAGVARNDALVMLENNSNAVIGAGAATNYNTVGNADIPPYSARLAVVKTVGANFSQTDTLYMVLLATFTTGAAALTNFTDVRVFCELATTITPSMIEDRTRTFLITPERGYNMTASTNIFHDTTHSWRPGLPFPDNADCIAVGDFLVSDDYVSDLAVEYVVTPMASGNLRSSIIISGGACGEPTPIITSPLATTAVTSAQLNCIESTALAGVAIGDIIHIWYARQGTSGLDTIGNTVNFVGFLVSYTADS